MKTEVLGVQINGILNDLCMFQPCHLQIHGSYSLLRGIQAEPPLSVESAKGIILVHGKQGEYGSFYG